MLFPRFLTQLWRNCTKQLSIIVGQPIFTGGLLLLAIWLFSQIALLGTFGDEQENFVAAWLVTQGLVPYRDFFFHHAPLPYFLGAPLYLLGSQPWMWFRWVMVGWFSLTGILTAWLVHPKWRVAVGLSWVGLALLAPSLHLQMFLAESWFVLAVVSLMVLVVSFWQLGIPKFSAVMWAWLILGWVAIGLSIVTIPSVVWLLGGIGLAQWQSKTKLKLTWRWWLGCAVVLYGAWIAYFAWHQALPEAYWAIFTYNLEYYFPLRLAGSAAQAQAGYFGMVLTHFWQYGLTMSQEFVTPACIGGAP